MISLTKTLKAIVKALNRIDNKSFVRETFSTSGIWAPQHDGIVTCSGRATAAGAYLFCEDLTDNEYVGMCTIANNQEYGSICFAVIKGHKYSFIRGNWGEPHNIYIHQN